MPTEVVILFIYLAKLGRTKRDDVSSRDGEGSVFARRRLGAISE